jgi:hypothetical protein
MFFEGRRRRKRRRRRCMLFSNFFFFLKIEEVGRCFFQSSCFFQRGIAPGVKGSYTYFSF